ncbi:MAG: putative sulfate exporter family transporter [Acidimicrobiia bacterium]|nr:putative sulfate exporter family transporter [Acidimicrobiia bacterium]
MTTSTDRSNRIAHLLFGTTLDRVPGLIPGVVLASVTVLVAAALAELINSVLGYDGLVSFILVAIVLGMLIRNTVGLREVFEPGVAFTLKKVLRLGIILLGIRLSLLDVLEIGGSGIPIVVGAVLTGLFVATAATRWLNLSDRLGTLIAIGTGICGATAIVATAPGIGAKDEEVAYAVANITIFGVAAMFLYPFLGDLIFGGDIVKVGLFMGTSIHETAQVAGAGLIYDQSFDITASPSGADIAVVAKLVRNVLMVVAIPAITYLYARRRDVVEGGAARGTSLRQLFPVFILGFLVMAALRSIGDGAVDSGGRAFGLFGTETWGHLTGWIKTWAEYTLATAMAGVGLGTSIDQLKGLGFKPFVVGIAAALAVGIASLGLVSVFGPLISV